MMLYIGTAVIWCPFFFLVPLLFFHPAIFLFRLSLNASRISININRIVINISRTAINISPTAINISGGWININMTSKYINAERIYITTKLIYMIVVTINISRVGGIMILLAIFKYNVLLSSFLGKFYSFYLRKLWTCWAVNWFNVLFNFCCDVK